jgi:hypothetical protein
MVSLQAGRTGVLCAFVLLQIAGGPAFAQAAGTQAVAADAAKDAGPFGGCEPIGMTASGELVFPLECKHKIKLPDTPVASEEAAPISGEPPAVAAQPEPAASKATEARTVEIKTVEIKTAEIKAVEIKAAATDDKAAAAPMQAADDKPGVDVNAAEIVQDKPVAATAASVVDLKPAAPETLAATDKAVMPADRKPQDAKPAEVAGEKPAQESLAQQNLAQDKVVKRAGRRGLRTVASAGDPVAAKQQAAAKPAVAKKVVAKQVIANQVIAMAKPVQAVTPPAHAEEKPAAVQTAGLPGCAHYRSYNPASKSYRGFDGRMYACH